MASATLPPHEWSTVGRGRAAVSSSLGALLKARAADAARHGTAFEAPSIAFVPGKLGIAEVRRHTTPTLIVHTGGVTPSAAKALVGSDVGIEAFHVNDLQFDLMSHVLVPPARSLTAREVDDLGVAPSDLPRLLSTDPVARWHGWRPGVVVRVTLAASSDGYSYPIYRTVAPPE